LRDGGFQDQRRRKFKKNRCISCNYQSSLETKLSTYTTFFTDIFSTTLKLTNIQQVNKNVKEHKSSFRFNSL
jgi:hypothetical protein